MLLPLSANFDVTRIWLKIALMCTLGPTVLHEISSLPILAVHCGIEAEPWEIRESYKHHLKDTCVPAMNHGVWLVMT